MAKGTPVHTGEIFKTDFRQSQLKNQILTFQQETFSGVVENKFTSFL